MRQSHHFRSRLIPLRVSEPFPPLHLKTLLESTTNSAGHGTAITPLLFEPRRRVTMLASLKKLPTASHDVL